MVGSQILDYVLLDVSRSFAARCEFWSPGPSRMQGVPSRTHTVVATTAGVMVAKPIDYDIPDRIVHTDRDDLRQRDPSWRDRQGSDLKI